MAKITEQDKVDIANSTCVELSKHILGKYEATAADVFTTVEIITAVMIESITLSTSYSPQDAFQTFFLHVKDRLIAANVLPKDN